MARLARMLGVTWIVVAVLVLVFLVFALGASDESASGAEILAWSFGLLLGALAAASVGVALWLAGNRN